MKKIEVRSRVPEIYDAWQFDIDASWKEQDVYGAKPYGKGKPFVYTRGDYTDPIKHGDWIVTDGQDTDVYTDKQFHRLFVEIETMLLTT